MKHRLLAGVLITLLILSVVSAAHARLVSPWSIERLSKEASVIAVGEVLDTRTASTESREDHGYWIRDVNARIRILRVFSTGARPAPTAGDEITLWYEDYDHSKLTVVVSGYFFPNLVPGDCLAFPLTKTTADGQDRWKLIHREDYGLLRPCLKKAAVGPTAKTVEDFMLTELTNVFAHGTFADLAKSMESLRDENASVVTAVEERLIPLIEDDARWLEIAVATYNSMGVPRPTISHILHEPDLRWFGQALTAKALSHVAKLGLDRRIMQVTMDHLGTNAWGSAMTIVDNYHENPVALRLVKEHLEANDPAALDVAVPLIRKSEKRYQALKGTAVNAAVNLVGCSVPEPYTVLRSACVLILDYGSDSQFATLLREMEKSRTADHGKFLSIWGNLAYHETKSERVISVVATGLSDGSAWYGMDYRVCDIAASTLQRHAGVEFGASYKGSLTERNAALEKAKKWLAEHK